MDGHRRAVLRVTSEAGAPTKTNEMRYALTADTGSEAGQRRRQSVQETENEKCSAGRVEARQGRGAGDAIFSSVCGARAPYVPEHEKWPCATA